VRDFVEENEYIDGTDVEITAEYVVMYCEMYEYLREKGILEKDLREKEQTFLIESIESRGMYEDDFKNLLWNSYGDVYNTIRTLEVFAKENVIASSEMIKERIRLAEKELFYIYRILKLGKKGNYPIAKTIYEYSEKWFDEYFKQHYLRKMREKEMREKEEELLKKKFGKDQ